MARLSRLLPVGLLLCLYVLFAACSRLNPPGPGQPLVIGFPADPVYQQMAPSTEGMDGFGRDLAKMFAKSQHLEVRYVVAPDYQALMRLLGERKVHLAAATVVPASKDPELIYTRPLRESRQLIVQHVNSLPANSPHKLAGREIAMLPGAPQAQTLKSMGISPAPLFVEPQGVDELELLTLVARRRQELAASDELHFSVAANFHPDLSVALELPNKLAYVWAFHAEDHALQKLADDFLESAEKDGTLRRLNDRYFGHIRRMEARDIAVFLENVRSRLPAFRNDFKEAQEITGIDWRLLAALAYQESKWDALATSPTGVRGMMMLTADTADRLKVSNRLDARESIRAGAKYLASLMDDLPEEIRHPDRLWFALAAYNLGMGHLGGARSFAPGLKRDPNLWVDMKQVLPLMSRPEYYTRLKSGMARGGEAVILVENIRNYYDVLSRFEPIHTPPSMGESPVRKKKGNKKGAQSARRG